MRFDLSVLPLIKNPNAKVTKEEIAAVKSIQPKTRADCANVPRPCPFVSCRYNNYLHEISKRGGNPKDKRPAGFRVCYPDLDPTEVNPETSCALDVADRAELSGKPPTLKEVGKIYDQVRENVRLIEASALLKVRRELLKWQHAQAEQEARETGSSSPILVQSPDVNDGVGKNRAK